MTREYLELEAEICVHNVYIRTRERGREVCGLDRKKTFGPWKETSANLEKGDCIAETMGPYVSSGDVRRQARGLFMTFLLDVLHLFIMRQKISVLRWWL